MPESHLFTVHPSNLTVQTSKFFEFIESTDIWVYKPILIEMKHIIIITVLFVTGILSAQSDYDKGMEKAFELWKNDQWTEAEQFFERIAAAEPDAWLPNYYIAQMNSLKSWEEKDANKVKGQL